MNVLAPGFFNNIQDLPSNILYQFDHEDTASFSATLFTLLLVMTAVEGGILILCTIYTWCQLPAVGAPLDFWWIDSEMEESSYWEGEVLQDEQEDNLPTNNNNQEQPLSFLYNEHQSISSILGSSSSLQDHQGLYSLTGTTTSGPRSPSFDAWLERNGRIEAMLEERLWKQTIKSTPVCIPITSKKETIQHEAAQDDASNVHNASNDKGDSDTRNPQATTDQEQKTQVQLEDDDDDDDDSPTCCSICLTNYTPNDSVVGSSKCCRHVFHKQCLVRWLHVQTTCPCCRQELLSTPACNNNRTTATSSIPSFGAIATRFVAAAWPESDYTFETSDFFFFLF